jgi:hypothetical protein
MPAKDIYHQLIKKALEKDGWLITDDPYVISYGERFLFIDLGATNVSDSSSIIGATKGEEKIAIEIKNFRSKSPILDLEQAIGQYVLYQLLLKQVDPARKIYLAITQQMKEEIFSEPLGELVIEQLPLKLIVIDLKLQEVHEWIN